MSMTPIDLKAAIGSTYEVSRAGGADASRAGMQQAYFGRQLDKEITHGEHFVRESDKTGETQPDGHNNARGRNGEKGKGKKKSTKDAELLEAFNNSSVVDIRV